MQKDSFLFSGFAGKGGMDMLQIKKLSLIHKKDLRVILDDFNLVLNNGDKAVIIGEEGNGKSTLMKWIYNPSLIEDYIECARRLQKSEKSNLVQLLEMISDDELVEEMDMQKLIEDIEKEN